MKSIITLCFLAVTIINGQEKPDPASFFPSAVGNVWEYSTWEWGTQSGTYKTKILRDSVDAYGNRFLFYPSDIIYRNRPQRKVDTSYNVYLLHPSIDTINWKLYKLDADPGKTWRVQKDLPRTLARVDKIYTAYLWGKERYVKVIGYYRPPYPFEDSVVTENAVLERYVLLVSGIGEYYEYNTESGPVRILRGARINGVTYGTVDIKEEPKTIPPEFILYQNYPNPFNPETVISYQLSAFSKVSLKIFDVLGREIATLVNEEKQAGRHEITFDVRGLSSGVYIYTLTAGDRISSGKMVYTK